MRRILHGVVTKTSMQKTVSVRVDRVALHPKYHKRFTKSTVFLAHDPEGTAKVGEKVTIKETRPISKRKHWILVTSNLK